LEYDSPFIVEIVSETISNIILEGYRFDTTLPDSANVEYYGFVGIGNYISNKVLLNDAVQVESQGGSYLFYFI
jgi:hypothetical protein